MFVQNTETLKESLAAWPVHIESRIGLWFEGNLNSVMGVRRVLDVLQAELPEGCRILLLGPKECLAFFEMDERVAAYLPLMAFEPRRNSQSRLSRYLETRTQFRKMQSLGLGACLGVFDSASESIRSQALWRRFLGLAKIPNAASIDAQAFQASALSVSREVVLEPGPNAIAYANRFYHRVPAQALKVLVFLGYASEGSDELLARQHLAVQLIESRKNGWMGSETQLMVVHWLVLGDGSRIQHRQITDKLSNVLLVTWNQLVGHMAYADRVVPMQADITRIGHEMARKLAFVLI